jgi:hypothetical protein
VAVKTVKSCGHYIVRFNKRELATLNRAQAILSSARRRIDFANHANPEDREKDQDSLVASVETKLWEVCRLDGIGPYDG